MPKETSFRVSVFLEITTYDTKLTTCCQIDNGSEASLAKHFLFKNWNTNITNASVIGITGDREKLSHYKENAEIILGSKIVTIKNVYAYDKLETDLLLGNDFIQQFQEYHQTIYMVSLKTPCNHFIKIPRKHNPYVLIKENGGYKQRFLENPKNYSCKCLNLEWIKENLQKSYGENPLTKWEKNHELAILTLKDPSIIIRVRPMLYNEEDKTEFKVQIQELIHLGLIRPSKSPHSSPAFMVRNHAEIKRGKPRMVINYKELNKNCVFDGYFIPNKNNLINLAKGKTYFSKFDCKSGFWQIKLDEKSIPLTAFSTPNGHYEWIVMPFGLKNAPQIFQRKMDKIFSNKEFLIVYIDDILVCSNTYQEHLTHLKEFSNICVKEGIILSQKKAEINKTEIEFLGMIISKNGIELQTHISKKIVEFPDKLTTKQEIQKFLGCLNYAGDFIPDLAKKRNLLQKLIRKSNRLGWTEEHTICVKSLKEECSKLPKLRLPETSDNLVLQTDASDYHWGAILQTDLNEICRYTSGTFNEAEVNYSTNEKELLAIVKSIRKFSPFLLPKPFVVRTDNTQVSGLIFNKLPSEPQFRRLHRWQVLLSFYSFKIEYVKGTDNCFADFLSRNVQYGQ